MGALFRTSKKMWNKIWLSKPGRRSQVAKNTVSTKEVLYCLFFSCGDIVVQVPVLKGNNVTDGLTEILF